MQRKTIGNVELVCSDALQFLKSLPDNSVGLVITSPPYTDARSYGIRADMETAAWVEWMRPIVREACRVSKGLAFFNISDRVEDFCYKNGPEWLHADLTRLDGLHAVRPYAWVKSGPDFEDAGNGIPGSGGKHFHRNDWEPVYGYAEAGKLPPYWSNNTAFGSPPKYGPGGEMSVRGKDGNRANDPWKTKSRGGGVGGRLVNGEKKLGVKRSRLSSGSVCDGVVLPKISNPGNVLRVRVGGGHLGHPLAHEGEAPFPLGVPERFICWFCPPDEKVCDPFVGSGTTAHAAMIHGRPFIGCDLRESQIELSYRRLKTVTPSLFGEEVGCG